MTLKKFLLFLFILTIHHIGFGQASPSPHSSSDSKSFYVPVTDGTKLAVDVYFPHHYSDQKLPALFEFTRYWRSSEDPKTGEPIPSLRERDQYFLENGYILIKVDVRGTGASYGKRPGEYTPVEVMDAKSIIEWVIDQPWSDGSVGAYGTSYSGTTAELLCATQHPAIKAVIPGWSDFDTYESPTRPYGMVATSFIAMWSEYVAWLDHNLTEILQSSVRRVDEEFPSQAIAEHANNPNVLEGVVKGRYKDSKFADFTYEECSPMFWKKQISESHIPMLVLTSWLDAGTAEGTLLRLKHFKNPQYVVMMPTAHGGFSHASPFIVSGKAVEPVPSVSEQLKQQLDFFDYYLKNENTGVEDWPRIRYYNLGEETFKQTDVWPPEGQHNIRYFLGADKRLNPEPSGNKEGMDKYTVDYSVTTGVNNRWTTQMGQHILNLDNRNAADALMLTYTTAPLKEAVQITGTPVITLHLSTTHEEGAIFVYLEDVDPNGQSRYITEGGLLLEHRKLTHHEMFDGLPYHSFKQSDASPMPVGKTEEITFRLHPTSVLIQEGHSIRIGIAGADKDTFDRVPTEGTPTFTIYRNQEYISFLELPVIK